MNNNGDCDEKQAMLDTPVPIEPDSLPSESQRLQEVRFSALYSGPLPPAEQLRQYEDILPGAADRILAMAEGQTRHRQSIENHLLEMEKRNSIAGIRSGFSIGVIAIASAAFCAYLGHPAPALVIGGGGIIGLASVFIYGSRSKQGQSSGDEDDM